MGGAVLFGKPGKAMRQGPRAMELAALIYWGDRNLSRRSSRTMLELGHDVRKVTTPWRLKLSPSLTQGSSCLPSLGFKTQSLWDWLNPCSVHGKLQEIRFEIQRTALLGRENLCAMPEICDAWGPQVGA